MKCNLSEAAYKWHDGEQWHVGKLVMAIHPDDHDCKMFVSEDCGVLGLAPMETELIQVQHSHTRELEFVEWGKLSVYEVNEQPTNTGARG